MGHGVVGLGTRVPRRAHNGIEPDPEILGRRAPPLAPRGAPFLFLHFSKKKIYKNIFLDLGFTVLYPYRPAGGR